MADSEFDFGQVQQVSETPQFRPCCHGPAQKLRDLADAVRDGTAEPKDVAHRVLEATQKLPTTVTTQDATGLIAAINGLKDAMGSKPGFSEAQGALAFSETIVTLHVKAAEAGAHPTPQQRQELGDLAMRLNTLAKDHVGGSGGSQVLSEVKARTEVFIKQAQEANPLFGLSMVSAATPEAKPHLSEPAAKEARSETTKESSEEGKLSTAQELSKNVEPASKERAHEPVKEPVAEVAKTARSEVNGEQHKRTGESQAQRVENVPPSQLRSGEAPTGASVAKVASPAAPSQTSAPQQAHIAPFVAAARSVSSPTQSATYSASQSSSVRPPIACVAPSAGRAGAESVSASVASAVTKRGAHTVQGGAASLRGQARTVSLSRNGILAPGARATGRAGQVAQPKEVKAPGQQLARMGAPRGRGEVAPQAQRDQLSQRGVRRAQPAGGVKVGRDRGTPTISSDARVVVQGRSAIASPVQRIASMLAHLRARSPKELTKIRLERFGRPKELQVALAIRNRSQKIVERVKTLPLKDILKIKGIRSEPKLGKGGKDGVALSPREMLARREVRFMIRELAARLQSSLNPRSMIYKRVMTEMTMADLERLVSILGGNRAVKGLRKKLKGGEVTQVFESDISNSFLSQLASAASGGPTGGDAGGTEEPSASTEGAGAEASTETSTEEATLVADGAVPTDGCPGTTQKEARPLRHLHR